MPVDIKGTFLKSFISDAEVIKSGATEYVNGALHSQAIMGGKVYPEETCIEVILAIARYLYGDLSEQNLFKIGQLVARVNLHTMVAKAALRVMGGFMFSGPQFSTTFLNFLKRSIRSASPSLDIDVATPDIKTLIITFYDTKMPPKIFEGEWYEIFTFMGCTVQTSSLRHTSKVFSITIQADSFKNMETFVREQAELSTTKTSE